MAAKKIQEYVKGKIINPNVGSIHFSPNDEQDQSSINISNYRKFSDTSDKEIFIETENRKEPLTGKTDDIDITIQTPSSTKSSPGSKPKWGSHITDVKKNINNAMEDAYTAFNTLIKGDIKTGMDVDVGGMRASKTMSNIEKMEVMDDINECSTINKSLDNLSQRTDQRSVDILDSPNNLSAQEDIDSVDFQWFPTPKNISSHKTKQISSEKNMALPKKVQKSFIDNYEFPLAKFSSDDDKNEIEVKKRWRLIVSIAVLLISIGALSMKLLIGFIFGSVASYLLLVYYGFVHKRKNNDIMRLPTLKNLPSPSIPHIEETNDEDLDGFTSNQSTFSCWVNMLGVYDANTYNINQCHVVHMDIEEKSLRFRRPKKRIAHRAMWKDGRYQGLTFNSEIVIELDDVKIDLLPAGLVHKRLWSKKYPICVRFPKILTEVVSNASFSDLLNLKSQEIYLFGRTCRDKEELFRRLLNACRSVPVDYNMWNIIQQYLTRQTDSTEASRSHSYSKSSDSSTRKSSTNGDPEDDIKKVTYRVSNKEEEDNHELSVESVRWKSENSIPQLAEYVKYMSKFMPSDMFLITAKVMRLDINYVTCNPELLCINAFLGRIFWDFLRGSHWVEVIRNKIQCKLKKIHLPQFMDELTVVDIHFGKEIPLIRKFSRPYLDSRGLWFDADVAYTGGFSMILETKVNLFNLRNQMKKNHLDDDKRTNDLTNSNNGLPDDGLEHDIDKVRSQSQSHVSVEKTAAFLSSEEDSGESSSYSEDSGDESTKHDNLWLDDKPSANSGVATNPGSGGGSSKRIIRWVDKIARSPYFIKASDNKYIQRGMEMVSNTKLMLQVELHSVSGTLAINIPPPPSDRVWYGFRPSPILKLSAKPKVGQKEISISKVTDLIEKKLILEFQRVLVLPNMDDVALPLLVNGTLEKYLSSFQ